MVGWLYGEYLEEQNAEMMIAQSALTMSQVCWKLLHIIIFY
jgi:hypothetical protein